MSSALKKVIKRLRYPLDIMLLCVQWYLTYSLSYRDLEEMMQERGVHVDHTNIYRSQKPRFASAKRNADGMAFAIIGAWTETYIKIGSKHRYFYRAVDKHGKTVDFLATAKRDRKTALRFLTRAIQSHGVSRVITIDKSGTNTAAIGAYNTEHDTKIETRQCKYFNNIVKQDHRAIKRRIRPMLSFQTFRTASIVLGGIEAMQSWPFYLQSG